MTSLLLFALLSQTPTVDASTPPPMVSAETSPAEASAPLWNVAALATATVPTSLEGAAFMFGLRAELDILRVGAVLSFDRSGLTPLAMSEVRAWTGLLGYSVLHSAWYRVRALGGVTVLTTDTTAARLSPAVGATARVNWRFLGAELGATFSPFDFRQLDLRAAAILQGGLFELHVGYRARFLDASTTGTLATMLETAPAAGPHVALGIAL